jgi:uncharacterized YccA/Bax inhibitor family protein
MEEKMADKKTDANIKNPLGAAVLSALCPGVGFFYLGNFIKGITYMLILAALIVLAAHGKGADIPIFVLMCVGFHIFQIFDSYDEARKINRITAAEQPQAKQNISLQAAVVVLILGIVMQLATLNIISFRDISRLWPLVLIAIGIKYVYMYTKSKETNEGGSK